MNRDCFTLKRLAGANSEKKTDNRKDISAYRVAQKSEPPSRIIITLY